MKTGPDKPQTEDRSSKWQLLEALASREGLEARRILAPRKTTGPFPLSFSQERIWFLERFGRQGRFHIVEAVRILGPLGVQALSRSLGEIVRRHQVLRTRYQFVDGEPCQTVMERWQFELPLEDLSGLNEEAREERYRAWMAEETSRPFDLERDLTLRARLLRFGEHDAVLLIVMHHISSDGWSLSVFWRELAEYYRSFSSGGSPPESRELPLQYADFAAWQREWLQDQGLERLLEFWRRELDEIPVLQLPSDKLRPALQSHRGAIERDRFPSELTRKLRSLNRAQGVTMFMTLMAALQALLFRITRQENFGIGVPVANRNREELEHLIGFFVNNLAIRADLSGRPTFLDLLRKVRDATLRSLAGQELPFEKILAELHPERDLSRTPLFQVAFNMLALPDHRPRLSDDLKVERLTLEHADANFDFTFYVSETEKAVAIDVVYSADLFSRERMSELLSQYRLLLEQIVEDPTLSVEAYSLVTPSFRQVLPEPARALCDDWKGPVFSQVRRIATSAPKSVAISDGIRDWTYEELEAHSNRLGHFLRSRGVTRQDVIGIWASRNTPLIWTILGILKAGAAFLILDPAYPLQRLTEYARQAQPRGLFSTADWDPPEALRTRFPWFERLVAVPGTNGAGTTDLENFSADPLDVGLAAHDLAYVTFTSGSTGTPKGVLGEHGSLSHFLPWQEEAFGLGASDRFSLLSGLAFDPLQREIFTPLWVGARICIPTPDVLDTVGRLADWMKREAVTFAHLTPPMGQILLEGVGPEQTFDDLRCVYFVGDRLTGELVNKLRRSAPRATFVNSYGSAETQRAVGTLEIQPDHAEFQASEILPVGRGIPGVQLLVLNADGQPAGMGELGEIYVRSPHIARGYLGECSGADSAFGLNPFSGEETDRMYRTGDLGQRLPDGNVRFLGRTDDQLKIRGVRVEPAEISTILARHPGIRLAVVLGEQGPDDQPRLVAYVVLEPGREVTAADLRRQLGHFLPRSLVPSVFVFLSRIPLSPRGKIDRTALADERIRQAEENHSPVEVRSELEEKILQLWRTLLEANSFGTQDSFFDCGGHSLLAVRLLHRVEKALGANLPLTTFFQNPTIRGMAQAIEQQKGLSTWPVLVPIQPSGWRPPFFCVHPFCGDVVGFRIWTKYLGEDQPFYGLRARGLDGVGQPSKRIEEMAADYIQAIQWVQPSGPYFLGGYGPGAVTAFEMACQLRAAGEEVAMTTIINFAAPASSFHSPHFNPQFALRFTVNLPYWTWDLLHFAYAKAVFRSDELLRRESMVSGIAEKLRVNAPLQAAKLRLRDVARKVADEHDLATLNRGGVPPFHQLRQTRVARAHREALERYTPGLYRGGLLVFRTKRQPLVCSFARDMGWGEVAGGPIEIRQIPGSTRDLLKEPYARIFASELGRALRIAQSRY